MRVLVLGASGMLGSTLMRHFAQDPGLQAHGSLRRADAAALAPFGARGIAHTGVDTGDLPRVAALVHEVRPDAVLNCVGLVKQLDAANDPVEALRMNALLPHELARICSAAGSRLIHFSTDCVFAGTRGNYNERDAADADDLYGRSKRLGEVDYGGHLSLRTSFIGHERGTHHALLDWFRHAAAQPGAKLKGFRRAVFSGLTTVELAHVLRRHILPRPGLQGLYHIGAAPIDKHTLLSLVAAQYGISAQLQADMSLVVDRSLDSTALRRELGYEPPDWPRMIAALHADFLARQQEAQDPRQALAQGQHA